MGSTTASIDTAAAPASPEALGGSGSAGGVGLSRRAAVRWLATTIMVLVAVLGFVPWWLPALVIVRDLVVLASRPLLSSRGMTSLPEHVLAAPATAALLVGLPTLVLAGDQPLLGHTVGTVAAVLGWAITLWGLVLHWWVGAVHLWQVRTLLNQVPPTPRPSRTPRTPRAARGRRAEAAPSARGARRRAS